MRFSRTIWYRDDHGEIRRVEVESSDPGELDRVQRLYAELERRSAADEERWRASHGSFADLPRALNPDTLAESVRGRDNPEGFPWDADDVRYSFSLHLGEGSVSHSPGSWYTHRGDDGESRYGDEAARRGNVDAEGATIARDGACSLHGPEPLPMVACCLRCCRSGRDLAIPRPSPWDMKRRETPKPSATQLPERKKDRAGRELVGGLAGKR